MEGDNNNRKKPKCMCGLMGLGLGGFIISVLDVVIATAFWIGLFTTERKEHFVSRIKALFNKIVTLLFSPRASRSRS